MKDKIQKILLVSFPSIITFLMIIFSEKLINWVFILNFVVTYFLIFMGGTRVKIFKKYFLIFLALWLYFGFVGLGFTIPVKTVYQIPEHFEYRKYEDSVKIYIDGKDYSSQKIRIYKIIEKVEKDDIVTMKKFNSYGSTIFEEIRICGTTL